MFGKVVWQSNCALFPTNQHVMSEVTLSNTQEKLPLFNEMLDTLSVKDLQLSSLLPLSGYATNVSQAVTDTAGSIYKKYFDWEYFSNELEFE
jgi:hypothetical protein